MAEKDTGNENKASGAEGKAEEKKRSKRFFMEMLLEYGQWLGIVLAIMSGVKEKPQPGEKGPGGKEIPGWILRIFSSLTREDETEFNLILDSHPDPRILTAEPTFRANFIVEGFDETDYRLSLVDLRREYLERLRNPAPEDKSGGRLGFTSIVLKDSATEFLSQLIAEKNAGGTDEEVFERQRKIALNRKLIKKMSIPKKIFRWSQNHKLETIAWIVLTPFLLGALAYQLLNYLLG